MNQRNIYTSQVHRFCNLAMASDPQAYIKIIGKHKAFDASKMANDFIYQHALEDTDKYESTLTEVHHWWSRYIGNPKLLE